MAPQTLLGPGPATIAARAAAAMPRQRAPISQTLLGRDRYAPPAWARFMVTIAYYLDAQGRPSWESGARAPVQCFASLARARAFAIQAMRRAPIIPWPDGCPTIWALLSALPRNRADGDGVCFQSWDAGGVEVKSHPIPTGYHGSR